MRQTFPCTEGRYFNGDYDAYCDLPVYIFCGELLLAA